MKQMIIIVMMVLVMWQVVEQEASAQLAASLEERVVSVAKQLPADEENPQGSTVRKTTPATNGVIAYGLSESVGVAVLLQLTPKWGSVFSAAHGSHSGGSSSQPALVLNKRRAGGG